MTEFNENIKYPKKKVTEIIEVLDTAENYRKDFTIQFRSKVRELIIEAFGIEDFCDQLFLPFNQSKDGFTDMEYERLRIFSKHCMNLGKEIQDYINIEQLGGIVKRKAICTKEVDDE